MCRISVSEERCSRLIVFFRRQRPESDLLRQQHSVRYEPFAEGSGTHLNPARHSKRARVAFLERVEVLLHASREEVAHRGVARESSRAVRSVLVASTVHRVLERRFSQGRVAGRAQSEQRRHALRGSLRVLGDVEDEVPLVLAAFLHALLKVGGIVKFNRRADVREIQTILYAICIRFPGISDSLPVSM